MLANEILDGVSKAIRAVYPKAQIWFRSVEQGLLEGGFVLTYLTSGREHFPGGRFRETHSYQVTYFPHNPEDALDMGDKLLDLLEYIVVPGGTLRVSGAGYEMADELLQVTLRYSCICRKVNAADAMEVMDYAAEF